MKAKKLHLKKIKVINFPELSSRFWKSAVIVMITAMLYQYVLQDRNPCFACIGAMYALGSCFSEGLANGINRSIGTFIGGIMVIPTYYLYFNPPLGTPSWMWLVLGLMIVIFLCLAFSVDSSIQPAIVVYFVVLFTVGQERVTTYTIARIIDTFGGAMLASLFSLVFPTPVDQHNGVKITNIGKGYILNEIRVALHSYIASNHDSRHIEHVRHNVNENQ